MGQNEGKTVRKAAQQRQAETKGRVGKMGLHFPWGFLNKDGHGGLQKMKNDSILSHAEGTKELD